MTITRHTAQTIKYPVNVIASTADTVAASKGRGAMWKMLGMSDTVNHSMKLIGGVRTRFS